jgi:hypothetical protein
VLAGWRELFELWQSQDRESGEVGGSGALRYAFSRAWRRRVRNWGYSAPLEDVLMWTPPSRSLSHGEISFDRNIVKKARWTVDRFTYTYLDDWWTGSLYSEWAYMHSRLPGCVASPQMALRRVKAEELAEHIVERAIQQEDNPERPMVRVSDFTFAAAGNLKVGRIDAAVAMFEALNQMRPGDPDVLNNLGFCLLPSDPAGALKALEESAALRTDPDPTTSANRILALRILGRDAEALSLADYQLSMPHTQSAWLWRLDEDGSLRIEAHVDTRTYIAGMRDDLISTGHVGLEDTDEAPDTA